MIHPEIAILVLRVDQVLAYVIEHTPPPFVAEEWVPGDVDDMAPTQMLVPRCDSETRVTAMLLVA